MCRNLDVSQPSVPPYRRAAIDQARLSFGSGLFTEFRRCGTITEISYDKWSTFQKGPERYLLVQARFPEFVSTTQTEDGSCTCEMYIFYVLKSFLLSSLIGSILEPFFVFANLCGVRDLNARGPVIPRSMLTIGTCACWS